MIVFVNDRQVDIRKGSTIWDAVREIDRGLAEMLERGAAYVTDGVGRTVDVAEEVREAGKVYRVVVAARRGPAQLTKQDLLRWPKVELHVHLDGCLRPETMLELGRERGVALPADTPEALAKALYVRDAKSLEEYLERYQFTLAVLQTPAALERVAYELVIDCAAENVRYVEVRYSPLLHRPAMNIAQAIEAPLEGFKRAESETGTKVGVIVCGIRTLPPASSLELASVAVEYRSAGVVAFDLAGAERSHPARDHQQAFAHAAAHGLACTCHAGEGDGPGSIREALHVCGAQRIGHGTRLLEDPALLDEVVERRIPLEMCISSNVHTGAVPAAPEHPFRKYLESGVIVSLNTDSRLMDGVTLTNEYHLAHVALGVSKAQLAQTVLHAAESAFLQESEKVALTSRLKSELEGLG